MTEAPSIVWFRQDLRLADQAAFAAAADDGPVLAVYVLDDDAPGDWRIGGAQRWWLHRSLASLSEQLEAVGVSLVLRRGNAVEQIAQVAEETGATRVHCLAHYEPWWCDAEKKLAERIELVRHDGYLLIDPDEIRTGSGSQFRVFAPFWKVLQAKMPPAKPKAVPASVKGMTKPPVSEHLADWKLLPEGPDWTGGFSDWKPGEAGAAETLKAFTGNVTRYEHDRNLPSIDGSSRLSPHLHMGEISPAAVWHAVADRTGAEPFLRELAWRSAK